jgi:hypothetical protein
VSTSRMSRRMFQNMDMSTLTNLKEGRARPGQRSEAALSQRRATVPGARLAAYRWTRPIRPHPDRRMS